MIIWDHLGVIWEGSGRGSAESLEKTSELLAALGAPGVSGKVRFRNRGFGGRGYNQKPMSWNNYKQIKVIESNLSEIQELLGTEIHILIIRVFKLLSVWT